MSSTTAYDAIKDRLVTVFGGTYSVCDFESIETLLQQGEDPFLAVDDSAGSGTLESIGAPDENWTRDTGSVIVHVFVPSTGSLATARTIAGQVREALRFYRFTVPDGEVLRCLNLDPPSPGVTHQGRWHSNLLPADYEHSYPVATAT